MNISDTPTAMSCMVDTMNATDREEHVHCKLKHSYTCIYNYTCILRFTHCAHFLADNNIMTFFYNHSYKMIILKSIDASYVSIVLVENSLQVYVLYIKSSASGDSLL